MQQDKAQEGLQQIERAVALAEGRGQSPRWLWRAYLQIARQTRTSDPDRSAAAYRKFFEIAPPAAIRDEAGVYDDGSPDDPKWRDEENLLKRDLLAKLAAGIATRAELRLLKTVCTSEGDRDCRDRATKALDKLDRGCRPGDPLCE